MRKRKTDNDHLLLGGGLKKETSHTLLLTVARHQKVDDLLRPAQPILHVVHPVHQLLDRAQQIQIGLGNLPRRGEQLGRAGATERLAHRCEGRPRVPLSGVAEQIAPGAGTGDHFPHRRCDPMRAMLRCCTIELQRLADPLVDVETGGGNVLRPGDDGRLHYPTFPRWCAGKPGAAVQPTK